MEGDIVSVLSYGSFAKGKIKPGLSDLADVYLFLRRENFEDKDRFLNAISVIVESCEYLTANGIPFNHAFSYFSEDDISCLPEIFKEANRSGDKYVAQLLPEYIDRLSWSRDKILEEQTKALRSLLIHANSNSEWYRKRLSDIDPASATIEDLDKIPPMNKKDLMENWDSIVTNKRAKLSDANTHISEIKSDKYFLDDYHVIISGGSSGVRGIFLYDWHG